MHENNSSHPHLSALLNEPRNVCKPYFSFSHQPAVLQPRRAPDFALSVTHLVAPTPQAKGKIERHMRTLQHRLKALVLDAIASAGVANLAGAAPVVARHVAFWNANHANRTTELTPQEAYRRCAAAGKTDYRPAPSPKLMDLFAARHETRAVVGGNRIEFMGRSYEIGATSRKRVWLVIHPNVFHVVEEDPLAHRDRWPPRLGSFSR